MTRHRGHLIGLVAALTLGLTACGGGDPSAQSSTSPSSSPSTSAPTSTAPSPTGPPAQPKGKYGVTVDILNWDKYATDSAVLAYKRAAEAFQGSANLGHLAPGFTQSFAKPMQRKLVSGLQFGWTHHLHMPKTVKARVVASRSRGATTTVVDCAWGPTYGYYDSHDKWYGTPERYWLRESWTLRKVGGQWKVTAGKSAGKCAGGAPQ